MSLVTPALAGGFFTTSTTWEVTSVGERDRERQREGGEERREGTGKEGRDREGGCECIYTCHGSSRKDTWRWLCAGLPSAPCMFLSQISAPAAASVSSQH